MTDIRLSISIDGAVPKVFTMEDDSGNEYVVTVARKVKTDETGRQYRDLYGQSAEPIARAYGSSPQ